MATDDATRTNPEPRHRGVDAWLGRYSRWKERRLTHMAATPLADLVLQNFYLCGCILLDGVFLPWGVAVIAGGFSLGLFALLFLPAVVLEGLLYQRLQLRTAKA